MFVELLLLTVLTYVAMLIGTATGFGISTIMVPILLFFFPPIETLLFVGIIHWFGDIWKMTLFRSGADWRLILLFGVPGVIMSYFGASVGLGIPSETLSRVIGVILILYVGFVALDPGFKLPKRDATAVSGGFLYGFVSGVAGIGGELRAAFLSAFNLKKAAFLFTNGAIAFFTDAVRVGTYTLGGTRLDPLLLWGMVVFIPVSYLGARSAKAVVKRIPERRFRQVVALFLFLVAVKFVVAP